MSCNKHYCLSLFLQSSAARDESVTGIKLASSQADLPKRSMKDSYCEASIPLGSDKKLREKYVNFHNTVRFGRVLEDLDTMAGKMIYKVSPSCIHFDALFNEKAIILLFFYVSVLILLALIQF